MTSLGLLALYTFLKTWQDNNVPNNNKPVTKKALHLTEARLDQKIDSVKKELHLTEARLDGKMDSVNKDILMAHEDKLSKHEKRITALETKSD